MDGRVRNTRRGESVEGRVLEEKLEPLQPPPKFQIVGPLSQVTCPAAKTLFQCLIQQLVDTGRAEDLTT